MRNVILIVEDEAILRELIAELISREGYVVQTAGTAEKAWTLVESSPDSYPLIIVDLTLPGMGGDELMRRTLDRSATAHVVLTSGYPFNLDSLPPGLRHRATFLQKPYQPKQLLERVAEVLDS